MEAAICFYTTDRGNCIDESLCQTAANVAWKPNVDGIDEGECIVCKASSNSDDYSDCPDQACYLLGEGYATDVEEETRCSGMRV